MITIQQLEGFNIVVEVTHIVVVPPCASPHCCTAGVRLDLFCVRHDCLSDNLQKVDSVSECSSDNVSVIMCSTDSIKAGSQPILFQLNRVPFCLVDPGGSALPAYALEQQ